MLFISIITIYCDIGFLNKKFIKRRKMLASIKIVSVDPFEIQLETKLALFHTFNPGVHRQRVT